MSVTADLVVRGLEEELLRKVRADAAMRGESLKEWVVRVLEEALNQRASGSSGQSKYPEVPNLAPLEKRSTGSKTQVEHPVGNREDAGSNPARGSKTCKHGFLTHAECFFQDGRYIPVLERPYVGPAHDPECGCKVCVERRGLK